MAGILEWFIDVGIEVKESNLTGYVIIPIIDKNHWTDRSQWEENRTFLKPYAKEITEILNEIRKDVEPDVIEI